jgi:hypothetical protein
MKHPLYLALAGFACAYLAFANLRGWSFWQTISPTRWISSASGPRHK